MMTNIPPRSTESPSGFSDRKVKDKKPSLPQVAKYLVGHVVVQLLSRVQLFLTHHQGWSNFFSKEPDNKYLRLLRPAGLCGYFTLPL